MDRQGVGKVVENGPAASKFPIGTRVVAVPWNTFTGDGTWQQYTAVPDDKLVCNTEPASTIWHSIMRLVLVPCSPNESDGEKHSHEIAALFCR